MTHTDQHNHAAPALHNALVFRKRALCKVLGISPAHLDRLRARGEFPKPVMLGEQAVGWPVASVQAWIESRPTALH